MIPLRTFASLAIALAILPLCLRSQEPKPPRHRTLPAALREVSGMARLSNGDVWLLNDSHNTPEIFRYDPVTDKVLETRRLPTINRDWEDLSSDPAGNLYIGDFGNNRNARRNLRIYRYHPESGRLDSILFRYPDQRAFPPYRTEDWNFNCEAMVFFRDSLHLFSKNVFQGNFFTKHYVLPARPSRAGADGKPEEYVAELRDSLLVPNRVITGAAISPDGQTLALTGYIIELRLGFLPHTAASVMYFTGFRGSHFLQGKMTRRRLPKCLVARQFESVMPRTEKWWMVANEGKGSWKQGVWRVKGP